MMKKIVLFSILFMLASWLHAGTLIRVSQESGAGVGDFDGNVLGVIEAFTSNSNADALFVRNDCCDAFVPGSSRSAHSFFIDTPEGLSFFFNLNDSGGAGGASNVQFDLLNDTFVVKSADDNTGEVNNVNPNRIIGDWAWGSCCGDGGAMGTLDGDWTMTVQFLSRSNVDDWTSFSVTGDNFGHSLSSGRRVRFEALSGVVPEPASVTLMLLGLGLGCLLVRN